jgi:hypothetical protein
MAQERRINRNPFMAQCPATAGGFENDDGSVSHGEVKSSRRARVYLLGCSMFSFLTVAGSTRLTRLYFVLRTDGHPNDPSNFTPTECIIIIITFIRVQNVSHTH